MRRLLIAAPLLLASCSMFESSSPPPAAPQPDAASLVANAVDEAQAVSDKRFSDMRASLDQISADQAKLREQLVNLRDTAHEDRDAVIAAQAAAASASHLLLVTGLVAGFACLASVILAIVVIWQAVLLRRAQRASAFAELRIDEAAERAAMAAATRSSPAAATPAAQAAQAAPTNGPFARLRRRPPN